MGTIGGNLCQNTRCLYYHQSEFWRSTRNPCYKLGGQICHAEKDGDRCRSVCQSDGATALIALVALIRIVSRGGERLIPLSELYTGKGEAPHALEPDEILKEIIIPVPPGRTGAAFGKIRYRGAIDYPLVNAACTLTLSKDGLMDSVRLVLGALGPAPFLVRELSPFLRGKPLGEAEIERAKEMARAYALTHAVDNIGSTLAYRQKVTPALAARVLKEAYLKAGEERRVG
jgi:CO/xanthine dehydrogenase FAD-binding subunit